MPTIIIYGSVLIAFFYVTAVLLTLLHPALSITEPLKLEL